MPLQSLVQFEESEAQESCVIPSLDDFNTLSAEDLSGKGDVLVLKNKLIMREGEHNGVFYSWEELKGCIETGEGGGLYYDHADSASNWVGEVRNLRGDDEQKAIFGDLHIVDVLAAKKLRYGAKWGVSPSIDAEKLVKSGKKYALDPKFISFSLVLRPAVRETMLNEDTSERGLKKRFMEDNNNDEKLREIEELAAKKKKKDEEVMADEMKELRAKVESYENAELERKSNEVLQNGIGFGILVDEDLEKLKTLSDNGRDFVSEVINRVATTLNLKEDNDELSAYTAFVKKYMKEHKGATIADAAKAWKGKGKLDEKELAKKKYPYPYPYPKPKKMSESQDRMKAELSEEKASNDNLNKQMLAYMHAQEEI